MKNKKSLYILIPLVAIVWGLILWKMLSFSSAEDNQSYRFSSHVPTEIDDTTTYQIIANYSDPFLRSGRVVSKSSESRKTISGISKIRIKDISSIALAPTLSYSGQIEHNNNCTALITYKNSKHLLKKGDIIDEIQIVEIYQDSIKVSFLDKTYSYERK